MPESPLMLMNPRSIHLFQTPSLLNPPNGQPITIQDRSDSVDFCEHIPAAWPSEKHISDPDDGVDPGPTIFIEDPLRPDFMTNLREMNMRQYDRLSLTAQIPQIGVVLVGSPIGRVAVVTLHRLIPDPQKQLNSIEESCYTMRLDHLLPMSEQERKDQRPLQLLVGLSAGPVFGDQHRWRIMMLYQDFTTLSYEIYRPGHGPSEVRGGS